MAVKKRCAELPEPIIQHILSFLPEKDAAKTSILSKAWLSAWRTKPNLEFVFELFVGKNEFRPILGKEGEKRCKNFREYVNRTLKRYTEQKMNIETLKVDLTLLSFSPYYLVDLLFQIMQVVVETDVKKLHIIGDYELPRVVVGAKLLEDLSLTKVCMSHLSTEKIMWHSLKRLCLDKVDFDESMFGNIISSCPLLEILEISYAQDDNANNQQQFKVMEHHNLKRLAIRLYLRQNLILEEAPKLESLICRYENYVGDWIHGGLSLHSSQYQNLKMLDLWAVGITDEFFHNLEQKFPHLQDLIVRRCENLKKIRISSHSLQRIQLMYNCKLEEAHFDVPSIERLEYSCDECEIIPEFSFTATKGHWISYIRIHWRGNVDSSWFLQLKKLLVNLIPSEICLKVSIFGSIELDMDEIRKSVSFSEPPELQALCLRLSSSSIITALDGFFLICRPNSLSQDQGKNYSHSDYSWLKLLYDMLMMRTNQDLQEIKYWQHDLIQAKVEIYDLRIRRAGDEIVYFKKRLVDPQLEALDWESILNVLKRSSSPWDCELRRVYFMLNWKKRSMSKEEGKQMPKEAKESRSKAGWITKLVSITKSSWLDY